MIETGISALVRHLARVSEISMNIPPSTMDKGITLLLSLPVRSLDKCGIISPHHPIRPQVDTTAAVIRAAEAIMISLTLLILSPSETASSSPKERIFSLYLKSIIT